MKFKLNDMDYVRIGSVTPEMKAADVDFNVEKIVEAINKGVENDCYFMVFPELCLTGYSCADLFFQQKLLDSVVNGLFAIADKTEATKSTVAVGAPLKSKGKLYNCAVIISQGQIKGAVPKTFLDNSGEFYEERWFSGETDRIDDMINIGGDLTPFGADILFNIENMPDCSFGVEMCEDLWAVIPPSLNMASAGANIILNLSASDEFLGKTDYRMQLVQSQSARCMAAYVYSSAGPGESSTDIVCSGHSMIAENGSLLTQTERFRFDTQIIYSDIDIGYLNTQRVRNNTYGAAMPLQGFRVVNVEINESETDKFFRKIDEKPFIPENISKRKQTCNEILSIQTTGLLKRMKYIGCERAVIGISGGLDSTLALLATVQAFERLGYDMKNIYTVNMPGFGTTDRTRSNAEKLVEALGTTNLLIPIKRAVEQHFKDIGHDPETHDIVYENAQARERTQILMDLANKYKAIVIGTGDMSETALGWSTYNGDQMSMYGINSGIPKTLVKYIIKWCAEDVYTGDLSKLLKDIAETPISPELLPTSDSGELLQETEEELGPYIFHDFILYNMFRNGYTPAKIYFLAKMAFKDTFKDEQIKKWLKIFYKRFFSQQYKRSAMPDGVKIGTVAMSPRGDLRMPSDAEPMIWLREIENL